MNSICGDLSGTDDLFANSSAETVVDSIDFSLVLRETYLSTNSNMTKNSHENKLNGVPVEKNIDLHEAVQRDYSIIKETVAPDKSLVADGVVTEEYNFPSCNNNSTSQSIFKKNVKNEHAPHLGRISVDNNTNSIHTCQFCHAKIYTDNLLIKHIAQHHQDNVKTMFQERIPEKSLICRFCPYTVLIEHMECLVAHIVKNHFTEFKSFIDQCKNVQYSCDMKNSVIPNLDALFMQMSTDENKDTKNAIVDPSICNSSSQFINRNKNQLSDEDRIFFDRRKISTIKNVETRSELPIRRKLRFDELETPSKENIISGSTNMKLVTKCKPKPIKVKPVSKWKSVFSFKGKQINRRKSISELVTSTPNTLNDFKMDIRNKRYNKHTSVAKKKTKIELDTSVKEGKCVSKKYLVAVTDDEAFQIHNEAFQIHNKDVKVGISKKEKTPHSTILEIKKASCCSWTPPIESLKQFECAICLESFVNNADLLSHTRRKHSGPLKLLHPPYKCGQCEAKFYKNSILVKHCQFHHTPRCLKNEQRK